MGYGLAPKAKLGNKNQANDSQVNGRFIKKLKLGDGDKANVYFLTDGDAVYDDTFHQQVPRIFTNGSVFKEEVLCRIKIDGDCKYCDEGEYRTSKMFMAWLWVDQIFHKNRPNEKYAQTRLEDVAGGTWYVEDVYGPMLWHRGMGKDATLYNALATIYGQNGSLKTAMYSIGRLGEGIQSTYQVSPILSTYGKDFPSEATRLAGLLPGLDKVASGEITKLPDAIFGFVPSSTAAEKLPLTVARKAAVIVKSEDTSEEELLGKLAIELETKTSIENDDDDDVSGMF